VRLLRSGTVASVRLAKASGVPAYDRAVERAIEAAQPLPVPDDIELFQQLRDLTLVFRPSD
jgi:TonB family protein